MATTQDYEYRSFEIVRAFYNALLEVRRGDDDSPSEIEAVDNAFATAGRYGANPFDLEDDTMFDTMFDRGGFPQWSQKATTEEILTMGLALALLQV